MQTIPTTLRLSGVLKGEDCPAWHPHEQAESESKALDAIIAHMNRDALRIGLLCSSGPVHWHDVYQCWMAWGNFTIASGGFELFPLSESGVERFTEAYAVHQQSEHFKLAKRSDDIERIVRKRLEDAGHLYDTDRRTDAWRPFLVEERAIGRRLEAIYNGEA